MERNIIWTFYFIFFQGTYLRGAESSVGKFDPSLVRGHLAGVGGGVPVDEREVVVLARAAPTAEQVAE